MKRFRASRLWISLRNRYTFKPNSGMSHIESIWWDFSPGLSNIKRFIEEKQGISTDKIPLRGKREWSYRLSNYFFYLQTLFTYIVPFVLGFMGFTGIEIGSIAGSGKIISISFSVLLYFHHRKLYVEHGFRMWLLFVLEKNKQRFSKLKKKRKY